MPPTDETSGQRPHSGKDHPAERGADNGAGSLPDFAAPSLFGRHVYLRPMTPQDYGFVRMMDLSEQLGVRWRFRGATPSAEQWVQAGGSVLAQFLVIRAADQAPLGMTTAYQQSFQDQHAYLAVATFDPARRSPLMVFGASLFIEYVFTCWNFRKLYLELPEFNVSQVASGVGTLLVEEARLREHLYYNGRFWDKVILALYRRTWEELSGRTLSAALPPKPRIASVRRPPRDR